MNGTNVTGLISSSFRASDPSGNLGYVSTNEPAWKLGFTIERRFPITWFSNDFHEMKLDGLLAEGEIREITGAALDGLAVDGLYLGGAGGYVFAPDSSVPPALYASGKKAPFAIWGKKFEWGATGHWLIARFLGVESDEKVMLFIRGGKGEELVVTRGRQSTLSGYSAILFSLEEGRRGKGRRKRRIEDLEPPYSIWVVIRTNVTTEFVIDPSKLRRAGPLSEK